ncbi:MAG: HIRAN domain-containing protein [Paludibacteraceae bacterium]|nr:HIRAN domain-containing protein [Paludibacteraceae bacterium]
MSTEIVKLSPELLALVGTGKANSLMPFSREIFLLNIVVAGTTYCDKIHEVEPELSPGTVLRMIRQPQNEHDELAIGIHHKDIRIGWVPRELNEVISRLMDAGKEFFCRIDSVKNINSWVKINAKIYMVE